MAELFSYNRENFMFDQEQRLKREFQAQNVRIKRFELYREDVRDLVDLTVSKMDNYLLVNTLLFGFCILLFTEGRPEHGEHIEAPEWLFFLYAITTVGALMFILLGVWLAMHASIAAHSFGVRLLTQFVRLPVPSKQQLDASRGRAVEYEGMNVVTGMFRLPVLSQQLRRLNSAMDNLLAEDEGEEAMALPPAEALRHPPQNRQEARLSKEAFTAAAQQHIQLIRRCQANWQAYDAYARVCMGAGAIQLLQAFGYFCLEMLITEQGSAEPGLSCVLAFAGCAWLIARLDLYLSRSLMLLVAILIITPPVLATISIVLYKAAKTETPLLPAIFLLHTIWILLGLYFAKGEEIQQVTLPTRFRTVLYLDVFGWIDQAQGQESDRSVASFPSRRMAAVASTQSLLSAVPEDVTPGRQQASVAAAPASQQGLDGRQPSDLALEQAARDEEQLGLSGMGRQTSRAMSAGARPSSAAMRASLLQLCRKLESDLRGDLRLWEDPKVTALLENEQSMLERIAELRAGFDGQMLLLTSAAEDTPPGQVDPPANASSSSAAAGEGPDGLLWLRLEWTPSYEVMEYFYRFDTGDVLWSKPEEGRILDLESLGLELTVFAERVQALAELKLKEEEAEAAAARGGPGASASSNQAEVEQPDFCLRERSSTSSVVPNSFTCMTAPPVVTREEEDGPAQETRYGGQEAVQLSAEPARQAFFSTGSAFHPHRQGAPGLPRQISSAWVAWRASPGHRPWRAFMHASMMLACIWLMGTAWTVMHLAHADIPIKKIDPNETAMAEPRAIFDGPWPHRFFKPTGLACHENFGEGTTLLISEKYAVHELRLDEGTVEPALLGCLDEDAEFLAAGLRGLTLQCAADEADCAAAILGGGGGALLRCRGLRRGAQTEQQRRWAAERLGLHGGPWAGLAATGEGAGLWAVRGADAEGGRVVQLQPRRGSSAEFVPRLELFGAAAGAPAQPQQRLHALLEASGIVVSLSPTEGLEARAIASGQSLWRRRLPRQATWAGLCAAGSAVYLLGSGSAGAGAAAPGGAPALWRVDLPAELLAGGQEAE